jgi:hypothetical protein
VPVTLPIIFLLLYLNFRSKGRSQQRADSYARTRTRRKMSGYEQREMGKQKLVPFTFHAPEKRPFRTRVGAGFAAAGVAVATMVPANAKAAPAAARVDYPSGPPPG